MVSLKTNDSTGFVVLKSREISLRFVGETFFEIRYVLSVYFLRFPTETNRFSKKWFFSIFPRSSRQRNTRRGDVKDSNGPTATSVPYGPVRRAIENSYLDVWRVIETCGRFANGRSTRRPHCLITRPRGTTIRTVWRNFITVRAAFKSVTAGYPKGPPLSRGESFTGEFIAFWWPSSGKVCLPTTHSGNGPKTKIKLIETTKSNTFRLVQNNFNALKYIYI